MDEFNTDPMALESTIASMDETTVDEFESGMDFEKFIVLSKKELANFCRLVDPLTKAAIDEYGKSVMFRCVNETQVEVMYLNKPYLVRAVFENKSGKTTKSFAVSVSTLKKIVSSAFASLVIVEDDNVMNIALCDSLLYLETKVLSSELYQCRSIDPLKVLDRELTLYTFKKVGAILSQTERASEKVIAIKNGYAHFNTGIFTSKSTSPFNESPNFVVFIQVSSVLSTLADISKSNMHYDIVEDCLIVSSDSGFYCELPIGSEDKVNEFISPAAEQILQFESNISVINDTFLRLITVVKTLDYLSDIVTIEFTKDKMKLIISTVNQNKTSTYTFDIVEGAPDVIGDIKLTVDVLQVFLNIVGTDVKYAFTDNGLGISNEVGTFLIRKSH